jgi:hypothetical protein
MDFCRIGKLAIAMKHSIRKKWTCGVAGARTDVIPSGRRTRNISPAGAPAIVLEALVHYNLNRGMRTDKSTRCTTWE